MDIDLDVRIPELPLIDPILPRWWRCWTIVDQRCPDFDSIARVSIATLIYEHDGRLTPPMIHYHQGQYPTIVRCGLALIQRSS